MEEYYVIFLLIFHYIYIFFKNSYHGTFIPQYFIKNINKILQFLYFQIGIHLVVKNIKGSNNILISIKSTLYLSSLTQLYRIILVSLK